MVFAVGILLLIANEEIQAVGIESNRLRKNFKIKSDPSSSTTKAITKPCH